MRALFLFISLIIISINTYGVGQLYNDCPVPKVYLGNDTTLCPGNALYLDAGEFNEYLWNDGSTDRYLTVTEPGVYSVTVQNYCGNTNSDEILVEPAENPEININMPAEDYFCKGDNIEVTANVTNDTGSLIYSWTNDSDQPSTNVDTTGVYTVTVENEDGCVSSLEVEIEFQYPNEEERILLVTYDPEEKRNMVIWSKTPERRTKTVELYNMTIDTSVIATNDFRQTNFLVDADSDPSLQSYTYNIRIQDSCENYSSLRSEKAHRTMHLRVFTNQDAEMQLEWDKYLGFEYEYFYILRGTEPDRLELYDSLNINEAKDPAVYIDRNAELEVDYYYSIYVNTPDTVFIENSTGKKAGNGPFVHSVSNLEDNRLRSSSITPVDYADQFLTVYPNPSSGNTTIQYNLKDPADVFVGIYNISGLKIAEITKASDSSGPQSIHLNAEKFCFEKGIYILKLSIEGTGTLTRKIIFR